ncbi:PilN domain-containing protein [Komagataeibacter diospyri]|uniref:Fimbrial assembly family protein n=1 Tax=Komagataeibacter diospyri TaxID=1932662 RepID=A0A4P5NXC8_9PROT|nr:PilN domain-containing protein [Komagataeibacter diospyri]GCE84974.1 fimbrial assembly family protein [Komagataeibacter diospyri]
MDARVSLTMKIRDVRDWWLRQMRDLMPAWLRHESRAFDGYMIDCLPDRIMLRLPDGTAMPLPTPARQAEDGDIPAPDQSTMHDALAAIVTTHGRREVILHPDPAMLLEREVILPPAAEHSLDHVLTYEMDRLTPFVAADVVFGARVMRRDMAAGRLHVLLSLVPTAALRGLLPVLRTVGMEPVALEIPRPGHNPLRLSLTRRGSEAQRRTRHLLTGAAATCGGLAVVALILPFVLQSVAYARLDRRMASVRAPAQAATRIRQDIQGEAAGRNLMRAEQQRLGNPLVILDALTTALSDETYLTDLSLQQGRLLISGQSHATTAVIQAMNADPVFVAPSFAAPVTQSSDRGYSQFSIQATVGKH